MSFNTKLNRILLEEIDTRAFHISDKKFLAPIIHSGLQSRRTSKWEHVGDGIYIFFLGNRTLRNVAWWFSMYLKATDPILVEIKVDRSQLLMDDDTLLDKITMSKILQATGRKKAQWWDDEHYNRWTKYREQALARIRNGKTDVEDEYELEDGEEPEPADVQAVFPEEFLREFTDAISNIQDDELALRKVATKLIERYQIKPNLAFTCGSGAHGGPFHTAFVPVNSLPIIKVYLPDYDTNNWIATQ